MSGNPLWIPGSKGGNPSGRPRQSVRTPKGMLLRFINKNISSQKLQKLFDKLSEKDRLAFLVEVFPYVMPRASAEQLTPQQIDELYDRILNTSNLGKAL